MNLKKFKIYLWNKWRAYSLKNLKDQLEDLSFQIQTQQYEYPNTSNIFKDSEKAIRQIELLNQDIEEHLKKK